MKRTVITALLLILCLSLAACGVKPKDAGSVGNSSPGAATNGPDVSSNDPQDLPRGGRLVLGLHAEPTSLVSTHMQDGPSYSVGNLLYNGLLRLEDGNLVGDLAVNWSIEDDGLTITFDLRDDVRWHDGQPFTAADVVFTYESLMNEELKSPFRNRYLVNGQPVTFTALGDHQVQAKLPEPFSPFLTQLDLGILPRHLLEGVDDFTTSDFARNPVGTGPFKFVNWRPGESITLARYDDYHKGSPLLDEVAYLIIPNQDSAFSALRAGDVDTLLLGLPPQMAAQLRGDDIQLHTLPRDSVTGFMFNTKSPVIADPLVRRALAHALNREAMVQALLLGHGTVGDSPFTPATWAYDPTGPGMTQYEYDPEKAKSLLQEAGWTFDGDSWTKDGQVLEFTILNLNLTGQPIARMPEVAQSQWGSIGIKVKIETLDVPAWLARTYGAEKDYDIAVNRTGPGIDPNGYKALYFGPEEFNPLQYNNSRVNELFEKAAAATDLAERKKLYGEMQSIIWADLPFLPVFYEEFILPLNARVIAGEAHLDANYAPPFRNPEKLGVRP